MRPMELYDILTLENNKEYTIANMVDYKDSTYLYLIEIDENEDIIENTQTIVRRIIKDGEEAVEKVTNNEEYKEVAKLFFDLFKDLAVEETESTGEQSTN